MDARYGSTKQHLQTKLPMKYFKAVLAIALGVVHILRNQGGGGGFPNDYV